ncbi:MAG: fatty acid desaturase CarF family protein [Vulcanimicrobiota bacterium]
MQVLSLAQPKAPPAAVATAKPAAADTPSTPVAEDTVSIDQNPGSVNKPKSNLAHKVVGAAMAGGTAMLLTKMGMQIAAMPDLGTQLAAGAACVGAAVGAYAAADLASGVFHWTIDNYPSPDTPILGPMAAEFQVHHNDATDLSRGTLLSNMYPAGSAMSFPLLAAAFLTPTTPTVGLLTPALGAAAISFFAGGYLAQGSHRYSHEENPPAFAKFLQKTGLAQSPANHAQHHTKPWDTYYCIVNGMWNPVLDKTDFWRKLEAGVYKVTGAEPNSWRDPDVKARALGEIDRETFEQRMMTKGHQPNMY